MEAELSVTAPLYKSDSSQKLVVRVAKATIIVLIFTIVAVLYLIVSRPPEARAWAAGLAVFWTVAPPFWFCYEYFFLYRKDGTDDTMAVFTHGQHTSIAAWAGLSLALGALATSDYLKTDPTTLVCTKSVPVDTSSVILVCLPAGTS